MYKRQAPDPSPSGGGAAVAFDSDRVLNKSAHFANHGNIGKAWRALDQGSVVPASEAAASLEALTPHCSTLKLPKPESTHSCSPLAGR